MRSLRNAVVRFGSDDAGVTLVEYGIAIVLAITVGVLGLTALGTAVNDQLTSATECLNGTDPGCP